MYSESSYQYVCEAVMALLMAALHFKKRLPSKNSAMLERCRETQQCSAAARPGPGGLKIVQSLCEAGQHVIL